MGSKAEEGEWMGERGNRHREIKTKGRTRRPMLTSCWWRRRWWMLKPHVDVVDVV